MKDQAQPLTGEGARIPGWGFPAGESRPAAIEETFLYVRRTPAPQCRPAPRANKQRCWLC